MHDQRPLGEEPDPRSVQSEQARVLAHGWEVFETLPLGLHTEQVAHVELLEDPVQVVAHLDAPLRCVRRDQRGRAHEGHVRAHLHETERQRPSDARVQDVADDRHTQPFEASEPLPHRVEVEQGLCRVLVRAVPGVQHVTPDPLRQLERRAGRGVADHDRVRPHRLQRERRVLQGLALRHAGPARGEVDHVRRQSLRRELEGDPRPGGVLVEQVHDGASAQRRDLLDHARADLAEGLGGVEDPDHVLRGHIVHRQEVLVHALSS